MSGHDLSFIRDLMSVPTARDKQVKVGASNLGNPCTRCLADDLMAEAGGPVKSPFWLASWIGTAIHERLAVTMPNHWLKEHHMTLFEIDGYGEIESTTDLYLPELTLGLDYKSTTRNKLKYYKRVLEQGDESESLLPARYTLERYLNQIALYGMGVEDEGREVSDVGLFFVCRDGTGDNDVWWWDQPYDRGRAVSVAERSAKLWAWLQDGNDPDVLTKAPGCWYCLNVRGKKGRRTVIEREEVDL